MLLRRFTVAAEKTGRSCLLATRKELLVELRKVDHHLLLYTDLISQCISCIFFLQWVQCASWAAHIKIPKFCVWFFSPLSSSSDPHLCHCSCCWVKVAHWGQTIKKNNFFTKKEVARERERWDYYLDCDGFIHTCGISNLSLFRHLTSQGSLVSSSPWRSPATGSKTNFSSCRPSTTGDDYSQCSKHTVNSIGFLERIGRGSDLCCCSIL